jgi:hypothetical protein
LKIFDRYAPFRCMRIWGNSLPWITPNIKSIIMLWYSLLSPLGGL